MKTYTIKPLSWKGGRGQWGRSSYRALLPFGSYEVTRKSWFCDNCIDHQNGCGKAINASTFRCGQRETWRWGYCFDEYYDGNVFDCKTLKEGKQAAQNHWEERLKGALRELKK